MTQEEQREVLKPIIANLDTTIGCDFIPSDWQPPKGYELKKFTVGNVPVEHLIPEKKNGKVIYQLHGGGYVVPMVEPYRALALRYSQMAGGAEVVTIDYRHAPRYEAQVALEDAVLVYDWILKQEYKADDVLFIGDSAGGNLELVTVMYLRDNNMPLPKGIIAISPWACIDVSPKSREENRCRDLLIGESGSKMYYEVMDSSYFKHQELKLPYVSPAYGNYTGFPSLLIITGSYEILRDDSYMVAEAARKAGVDVIQTTYEKQSHDFPLFFWDTEEGVAAWEEMRNFTEKLFQEQSLSSSDSRD